MVKITSVPKNYYRGRPKKKRDRKAFKKSEIAMFAQEAKEDFTDEVP